LTRQREHVFVYRELQSGCQGERQAGRAGSSDVENARKTKAFADFQLGAPFSPAMLVLLSCNALLFARNPGDAAAFGVFVFAGKSICIRCNLTES
jgi:hypothetical protein